MCTTQPPRTSSTGANTIPNDGVRRSATYSVAVSMTARMTSSPIASPRSNTSFRVGHDEKPGKRFVGIPAARVVPPSLGAVMMVAVLSGEYHEIRLRGWRRVADRLLRPAPVRNVLGWLDCSVPGTRGRLRKASEPWRWRQG